MKRGQRASIALLALTTITSSAGAQDQCFNGPISLPMLSGPPEWFDMNGDGFWRPELHDPRWSGSAQQPLKFGEIQTQTVPPTPLPSAEDGTFRAVVSGGKLYVLLQAQVDANGPSSSDGVYFAFTKGSSNQAWAIRMNPQLTGAQPAAPPPQGGINSPQDTPLPYQYAGVFRIYESADSNPGAGDPVWNQTVSGIASAPSWFQAPALFDRPVANNPRWAIAFAIDLNDPAIAAAGDLRVFWGLALQDGTTGPGGIDIIKLLGNTSPKTDDDPVPSKVVGTPIPSRSSEWELLAAPGTACTGISVSMNDIGVWTGTPGSTSGGTLGNVLCATAACDGNPGNVENTFRVTARNVPNGLGIEPWAIRARVRIADWGATVAYWNYGPWKDVATTPTGTAIFTSASPSFTNANGWYWLTPVVDPGNPAVSSVTIDYQCDRGASPYCPMLTNSTAAARHQCVLVELGQKGTEFDFASPAVYRNMNYAGLSESEVPAVISLEGLEKATGIQGDVELYLKVDAVNLPKHQEKPQWLPTKDMALVRSLAEAPPSVPTKHVFREGQKPPAPRRRLSAAARPVPAEKAAEAARRNRVELDRLARLLGSERKLSEHVRLSHALSMNKEQLLDAVYPTYRVRPYYGTGKTFTHEGGTKHRVFEPMVPFGFHFEHDGSLYGFTHALGALAALTLEEVGQGWYRVKKVPAGGKIEVVTQVTAHEEPAKEPDTGTTSGTGGSGTRTEPEPVEKGRCNCRAAGDPSGAGGPLPWFGTLLVLTLVAALRGRARRATGA